MKLKSSILVLVLIILLIIMGFILFNGSLNTPNQVTVSNSVFTLPEGYHEGSLNSNEDINITNDTNSIFIKEYDTNNIQKCIDNYKNFKTKNGYNISIKNFNIGNIHGYKSTIDNETNIHYWFRFNNKTYSIYSWDKNTNIDSTVIELINSVKTSK